MALIRCHPHAGEYGKRILVWDPNFGKEIGGVQERSVLGFHQGFVEAAKRGSTTAEVWVNKRIREPNIDGRCPDARRRPV